MESECDLAGGACGYQIGNRNVLKFHTPGMAGSLPQLYIPLFSSSVAVQMLCRSVSRCISCRVSVFGLSHALNHGEPKKEEEEKEH